MGGDQATDLARLLAGDLSGLSLDDLVTVARRVEDTRDDTLRWSGRVLALLHDAHGLSWPAIARLTGIAQSTAHRRAQPYLSPDQSAER